MDPLKDRDFDLKWNAEIIDNFTLREARCHGWEPNIQDPNRIWHDCGLVILVPDVCYCVHQVRVEFWKPITVLSWTRCMPHNLAVGGRPDSYHPNGHAIDIAPVDLNDLDQLERIARKYFAFVKRYSWGLHCDIRGERPAIKREREIMAQKVSVRLPPEVIKAIDRSVECGPAYNRSQVVREALETTLMVENETF